MSAPSLSTSDPAPRTAPAIEVEDLSASYRVRLGADSAIAGVRARFRRNRIVREVPALRNVSFTVPRGTVLGVIGRNGAGKSTLLRTIAGILVPTTGRVVVRGRISPLLSVGLGMHAEMSGRENIRLGALAVGMDERRLDSLSESIADFAQLGEYVDFPIKTYSSGMRARLGFAVAVHLDPEVLLIDEALTGGDAKYKEKTGDKMFELCGEGRTIVLVSHSLTTVRSMASSALWLHQGKVAEFGDPDDVVMSYMRYCRIEESRLELIDDD